MLGNPITRVALVVGLENSPPLQANSPGRVTYVSRLLSANEWKQNGAEKKCLGGKFAFRLSFTVICCFSVLKLLFAFPNIAPSAT